ncbi:MAG: NAD(+) synthase [Crocinitomicaceae bacterium]|nr:NAD(+) synthase [Crocinitomicaceae bacterium]
MNTLRVIEHISDWLKLYSEKSKTKGFVVGISGGIDSAVTSALCARTGLPLLGVEIPIHQSDSQVSRAQEHIEWLMAKFSNVNAQRVELTDVFDQFIASVPPVENEVIRQLSLANTRARLRMTTLYYFAGLNGFLVAGTGNKVEDLGVGFFTKYGDGGVDISPIADLNKTEVYAVAKELEIVTSIQTAAPTDGLWGDDRTDVDQIGASYPELEWAMDYIGNNYEFDGLRILSKKSDSKNLSDREKEVIGIYIRMHNANVHKMIPIPVCTIPHSVRR